MLTAIFLFSLPVTSLAYLFVGYARYSGRMQAFADTKSRKGAVSAMRKARKESRKRKEPRNPLIDRWLAFGGGFYGLAAIYTYGFVELGEISRFIIQMLDPDNWTFDLTISLIIRLIINSIANFLQAILWFLYWGRAFGGVEAFIGFVLAYVGYLQAARVAQVHLEDGVGHVGLWRWLKDGGLSGAQSDAAQERPDDPPAPKDEDGTR